MESKKNCESLNESLKHSSGSVQQSNAANNDRTESYTAANAVAAQSQNIVPRLSVTYGTGQPAPAARIMYRPAFADVRDYMRTCTGRTLRSEVAEEEARAFLNYNDAKGWRITDWQEAARRWVNRTESRKGLAIYEDPQQTEADEERRKAEEERKHVDTLVDRISYKAFTDEDGIEARELFDMIQWDNFTDKSREGIAKKVGQRLIDLWAWTYAEIIIMETYETSSGGDYAKMIKDRIYSGVPFVSWFWHGMELKVKDYLEHWMKGPGRPIKRLVPIKITGGQEESEQENAVPEYWKYLKTLVERHDFSGGMNGPKVRRITEKIVRKDFSGGEDGEIAEWIVTGKAPASQHQPASTSQPQPLKGIINKALRNIRPKT